MMFRPRESHDLRLIEARLDIVPQPTRLRWVHDVFDNSVAVANFSGRTTELRFDSTVTLEHIESALPDYALEPEAATYPFTYADDELPGLALALKRQSPDPDIDRWAASFLVSAGWTDTISLLRAMTISIRSQLTYMRRTERGVQTPSETLRRRSGSCRDFALLMIDGVRSLGFAARFVSGYIFVPGAEPSSLLGGGATHAWLQVYLPGAGWIDFDPTNDIIGNRSLIQVAVAWDPAQALPLWGASLATPRPSSAWRSRSASPRPRVPRKGARKDSLVRRPSPSEYPDFCLILMQLSAPGRVASPRAGYSVMARISHVCPQEPARRRIGAVGGGWVDCEHPSRAASSDDYRYDRPVALGPQVVRLRPAPHCRTPILSYSLKVEPKDAFPQLAAGPAGQLPGARSSFPRRPTSSRSRSTSSPTWRSSTRSISSSSRRAETFPFAYDAALAERDRAVSQDAAGRPAAAGAGSAQIDRAPTHDHRLPRRAQRAAADATSATSSASSPASRPPRRRWSSGKGSCRDTAWLLVQILRHLGFAARFASGYLIQLVADEKPLDGPDGPDRRLHRSARLVRGLSAGRRLDRPRSDLGPARRRRPHSRSPARPSRRAPRRSRARSRRAKSMFAPRDEGDAASRETPRITKPYTDEQWQRPAGARRARRTRHRRAGRPPHHGRRADLRRRSTTWTARNGTRGARPGEAPAGRRAVPPARRPLRHGPAAAFRPGQMVSGRTAAALGARLPLAQGRRADLARPGPRRRAMARPTRRQPEAAPVASRTARRAPADRPRLLVRGLSRTPGTTCGASGGCPVNVDRRRAKLEGPSRSASGWRGCSSRAWIRRRHGLPADRARAQRRRAAGAAGRGSCAPENAT